MLVFLAIMVGWAAVAFLQTRRFLHYFQIEEYQNGRFLRWYLQHAPQLFPRAYWALAPALALSLIFAVLRPSDLAGLFLGLGWLALGAYLGFAAWRRTTPVKKPLVYTARAIRLLTASCLLSLLLVAGPALGRALGGGFGPFAVPDASQVAGMGLLLTLAVLGGPLLLILANLLWYPFDTFQRRRFLRQARGRLRAQPHTVIGITGSYGKTSTKDITAHLLDSRFSVVKTPQSYNTLMGVCKIINQGQAPANAEYFIAEMGAYRPGEIKALCGLLQPRMGILTAVGPMHLERFKTLANVARAKYELIAALPPDGLAVFNADDNICYQLAGDTHHVPVALYGFEKHLDALFLRAEELTLTRAGLGFVLVRPETGERVVCQTRLLGKHSLSNILAGATVALHCGLSLPEVAEAVSQIEPTPHRLELKQGAGGITVLDDAYNSNPTGARNALEILSAFDDGKRILITPGLVELGEIEIAENRQIGRLAAQACDLAILVGQERAEAINAGFAESGFPANQVIRVPSLQDAIRELRTVARRGDTVLLLNDLPDTYELIGA